MSPWMYLKGLRGSIIIITLLSGALILPFAAQGKSRVEIVIVSIDHCSPCQKLAKELDKLRELAGPSITIRQIYNKHEEIELQYHITIRSFPTILVIVNGKVIHMFVEYYPAQTLWNMIKSKLRL